MDVEVAGSAHSRTRSNKASDRPTKGSMCNTPRSPILKLRIISHKKFKKKVNSWVWVWEGMLMAGRVLRLRKERLFGWLVGCR